MLDEAYEVGLESRGFFLLVYSLCFLFMIEDVSSQLALPAAMSTCCHATLPFWGQTLVSLEPQVQINSSFYKLSRSCFITATEKSIRGFKVRL